MNRCDKWQDLLILRHYGELDLRRTRRLERHLSQCEKCRRAADQLETRLQTLTAPESAEPGEAFWNGFMSRLNQRLDRLDTRPEPKADLLLRPRGWVLAAAAVFLVILGGIVGRLVFPPHTPRIVAAASGGGFAMDLDGHLDNLHPLMVDCAATPPEAFAQSLPATRPRIRNLLLHNRLLMRRARERNDPLTLELLREIELVLLELSVPVAANDSRFGQVHNLVNRNGLVERMQLLRHRSQPLEGQEARI